MHKMIKPFICLTCNQSFTGKDASGFQTARFPFILNCSHTVCATCIKSSARQHKSVTCSKCQRVTHLVDGESSAETLQPDLHVLGSLSNFSRIIPRSFKVQLLPAGYSATSGKDASSSYIAKCENCNLNAKWRCDKCVATLCIKCFDSIHKSNKFLKNHRSRRICEQSYRSVIQVGCQEHDQKPFEFFCEDDNELACSHCAVTGKHSGHKMVTLLNKNECCVAEVARAVVAAKGMKSKLKTTEKKLAALVPNSKPNTQNLEISVRDYFHELHSALQIRETELHNQLASVAKNLNPLENLNQQVSESIKDISALLEDAASITNNSYLAINVVDLIEKLHQTLNLPCHLVPVESKGESKIQLHLDEKLKETLANIGDIEADLQQRFSLLPEKDLPPDYSADATENESTTDGETSSLNGSLLSDPASPGMLPSPDVLPPLPVIVKPKSCKSLLYELVHISHVKNPGKFWVRRAGDINKLKLLENNINRWCSREKDDLFYESQLELGAIYLVQYGNDQKWYRARLKGILGEPPVSESRVELLPCAPHAEPDQNKEKNVENDTSVASASISAESDDVDVADRDVLSASVDSTETLPCDISEKTIASESCDNTSVESASSAKGSSSQTDDTCFVTPNTSFVSTTVTSCADAVEDSEKLETDEKTDITNGESSDVCVQKMSPEFRVQVQYVDYGNSEVVSVSRIRMIQSQFLKLSCLALECSLWEIEPMPYGDWSQESVRMFAKLIGSNEVLMKVVDERSNILYIDLCKPPVSDVLNDAPVSVREALVFLEVAYFLNSQANFLSGVRRHNRQTFLPPDSLHSGMKLNVLVSYINSPSDFYIQQLGPGSRYLSDMSFELQDFYSNESQNQQLSIIVPKVGMVCVAKFTLDNKWYRAQVVGLPGGGMVEVFYVDFGNTEVVSCWHLSKVINKFMKLPAQAVHCSLADVEPVNPSEWTEEGTSWFKEATKKEVISMIVHESSSKGKAVISLFEVTESAVHCISGLLVVEGYAHSTGMRSSFTEERCNVQVVKKNEISEEVQKPVKQSTVKIKKKHNYNCVTVSYCEDPSCIFIQTAGKDEKLLESLMKTLKEAYSDSHPSDKQWLAEEYCVVFNPKDEKWYRGQIIANEKENVTVFLLDYGWTVTLDASNLRVLQEEFLTDDIFAIKCHLTGIVPAGDNKKWSRLACEFLCELLYSHKILYIKTKGSSENKSQPVDLFIKEVQPGTAVQPDIIVYCSVNEKLIDEGLAIPTQRNSKNSRVVAEEEVTVEDKDLDEKVVPSVSSNVVPAPVFPSIPLIESDTSLSWLPAIPLEESEMDILPTEVGYDGCIYFHPYGKADTQLKMMADTLVTAFQSDNNVHAIGLIREGQICMARFFLDQKWYRAEVVKVLGESLEVFFVDYGNFEKVGLNDVKTKVAFLQVPKQCHKAFLLNAMPLSSNGQWPKETLNFIHAQVVDKICHAQVEKRCESPLDIHISLELPGNINFLDVLESKNFIRPVEKPVIAITVDDLVQGRVKNIPYAKMPLLPLKLTIPVVVTQLFNANTICMQVLKIPTPTSLIEQDISDKHDHFLMMMENLAEDALSFVAVKDPKPGMNCCGLYTYDDNWYRCLILDILEDKASVYYVDYGNTEVLPLERLRQLPKYCLRVPTQGLICRLHGLKPGADVFDEQAYSSMMQLLFNDLPSKQNFVAEIMSSEYPLEVRLLVKDENSNQLKLAYEKLIDDGTFSL